MDSKQNINIIVLSGGAGTRLWPISTPDKPKQFLQLFEHNGTKESMIQRTYRMLSSTYPNANIVFSTEKSQKPLLESQLQHHHNPENDDSAQQQQNPENDATTQQQQNPENDATTQQQGFHICTEPAQNGTFPAICLSTLYLRDVLKLNEQESVVVCPADAYAEPEFYQQFKQIAEHTQANSCNLTLCGVVPTSLNTNYGYILPAGTGNTEKVLSFKEKPDTQIAEKLITKHALWNCGVFCFKIKYLAGIIKTTININTYEQLLSNYNKLEKTSFDYAVCEKEPLIDVIRYKGKWTDTGTWNSLATILNKDKNNIVFDLSQQ